MLINAIGRRYGASFIASHDMLGDYQQSACCLDGFIIRCHFPFLPNPFLGDSWKDSRTAERVEVGHRITDAEAGMTVRVETSVLFQGLLPYGDGVFSARAE